MRVVVGRALDTRTPMLLRIAYVEFRSGTCRSIIVKEIVPALRRWPNVSSGTTWSWSGQRRPGG
jgi:murein L,D-transpeptidase YcbB/YkuD